MKLAVTTETKRRGMFAPVSSRLDLVEQEHGILELWQRERAFEKLMEKNRGKPTFSFIDGPITANATTMGIHHAWARTYKDVFQRYKAMRGFAQRYQNGFDCHGLWVEVEVERELKLNSKRDIERYGLERFSEACRARVDRSGAAFTEQSIRLGQWMDWPNSYWTYTDKNIEHIWHVLKLCHERGWLYRGHRSMPWCARCGTALSQHELALGYREMTHLAVFVRFPIEGRERESFLVWTTTPWTLAANVALAVHPDLEYVRARHGDDVFVLSRGTVAAALRGAYEILETLRGRDLVGLRFRGPFDDLPAASEGIRGHRVIAWDGVGEAEGTGIVHIAPGCGAEDFALSKTEDLPVLVPIDDMARYRSGYAWLEGRDAREVSQEIADDLKRKGLLYRVEDYTHRYPECWRCHEELVFRVDDEWFISMEELRPKLIEAARKVDWVPPHAGPRMENWLENMGDWNISRRRYWGLPLPFYTCPNGHFFVIGSAEELRRRAKRGLEHLRELHMPWIDRVVVGCPVDGEDSTRVKEVGDCWLDAGIVPFSTLDYLRGRADWEKWFPADFVVEMVEQVRLWFYSLLFFSVVLTERAPYRTVMTFEPMMLAPGVEFHKTGENVVYLPEAMERSGADAIRWMVSRHRLDETMYFNWEALDDVRRRLLTLWNTYAFFVTYANLDGFDPNGEAPPVAERPALDRWILSRLASLAQEVTADLQRYDPQGPALAMERFWDELSNWYVRRSRRRFWKSANDAEKRAAEHTLYEVLTTLTRLFAPYMPFLAEAIYQNLERRVRRGARESVHHTDWPDASAALIDADLERAMAAVLRVVSVGRAARSAAGVKVRMPLARLVAVVPDAEERRLASAHLDLVRDELNVKEVDLVERAEEHFDLVVKPDLKVLGPKLGKDLPKAQAALREKARLLPDGRVAAGEFAFAADEVLLERRPKPGFAVAGEAPYFGVVDTRRTPDLEAEGLARELVHTVQNLRKDAGLDIADRIVLRYDGDVAPVVERFRDEIAAEVLATRLERGVREFTSEPPEARRGPDLRGSVWRGKLNGVDAALEVVRL